MHAYAINAATYAVLSYLGRNRDIRSLESKLSN